MTGMNFSKPEFQTLCESYRPTVLRFCQPLHSLCQLLHCGLISLQRIGQHLSSPLNGEGLVERRFDY